MKGINMMQKIKAKCWDGKRKYVAIPVVLILIPSAAFAAFLFLLGMGGSVRTATVNPELWQASTTSSTSATCTPTIANGRINLAITNAFPGGECTIKVNMNRPSVDQAVPMVTQNIEFTETNMVTTKFAPGSCGVIANERGMTANIFSFTVKISDSAPMGTTYPAKAGAGVSLVPQSDYSVAACPTW